MLFKESVYVLAIHTEVQGEDRVVLWMRQGWLTQGWL